MSAAREAMPADELLHEVETYVLDHCLRGGAEEKPLPYIEQPDHVRAAIWFTASLRRQIA